MLLMFIYAGFIPLSKYNTLTPRPVKNLAWSKINEIKGITTIVTVFSESIAGIW